MSENTPRPDQTKPDGVLARSTQDAARTYRNLVTGRTCGTCRVCCRLPDIPELSKPVSTWCRHIDLNQPQGGCTIYEDRPRTCREYECAWLSGLGEEQDRPDRLGVMYQPVKMPDGSQGLAAVEAEDGAFDRPRVRAQLARFAELKPGRIMMRTAAETQFRAVEITVSARTNRKIGLARLAGAARPA